jgi:tRNA(fMet)-specific endonuclease VapC
MRRFLFDTGIAGDMIYRRAGVFARFAASLRRGDRVGIGLPVLGELLAGAAMSNAPAKHHDRVIRNLARLRLWPFDQKAAEEYGRLRAALRRLGRAMQQVDMQVAAIALSLGNCTVVTKDIDLAAVPGLKVEDWSV